MKKIEIRLFGTPAILADGEPVNFPYKKAEGFLYYLCVKKKITREEAICLLWGDEDEASGRKKLRDAIYQVRKKLDKDLILTFGHTGIALNPACPVAVDWDRVEKGRLGEQKPFLEYFYIKKCLEFEDWVGEIRDMQSLESVKNAAGKLKEAREARDLKGIQKYGVLLIKEDPYNEELYYELMSAYAENGDYVMAIRLYYDLENCLRDEMGVEPSKKIRELFQRVFHVKEHLKAAGEPAELPFVGREKELFALSEFLERDPENPANCLVIAGEEGSGKTALLENGMKLAASRQMVTLKSSCYRQGTDFFLNPWSDILQELGQIRENGSPGLLSGRDGERLAMILKMEKAGGDESRRLTYSMIERELLELFSGIGGRFRILLVFDDIQWMDRMSFQLLNRILGSAAKDGVSAVCTCSKNGEMDVLTALEPLVRGDRISIIRLEPFTQEETAEILRRTLPEVAGDPEKCRSIYKSTEGNAFFLREMVNLIRKKGFTLEKSVKTNLAIQARLSSVGREEREVLECMAVFPEKIGIEELEYLMKDTDRLALLKRLERLSGVFLIQEVLVGWNVYYKFTHRLFQEYVYEKQSNGKKLQYHRMLAEYYGGQTEPGFRTLALAAYHYEKCHDQVQAYRCQIYYLKEFYTIVNENFPVLHSRMPEQGDEFGVVTGAERMLELAEHVIGLKNSSPVIGQMKMEMYYIKGRYGIAMGDYDQGNSDISQAMALAAALGDDEAYLACLKQQIFYGIQTGNTELVEDLVAQGTRCRAGEKEEEYATLLRIRGLCLMQKGEYQRAREILLRALAIFERLDREIYGAGAAACHNYLGDAYRSQGLFKEAMDSYEKALAVGRSLPFMNGLGQIYSGMGQVRCLEGRYGEAMELLEKARDCLEKSGYRWGLERTEAWLALTCLETGNQREAREHYEKGKRISDRIRNPETERLLAKAGSRLGIV